MNSGPLCALCAIALYQRLRSLATQKRNLFKSFRASPPSRFAMLKLKRQTAHKEKFSGFSHTCLSQRMLLHGFSTNGIKNNLPTLHKVASTL
jgi:hypothetical protein